jgi:phosphoserine phosphatase RsbU/P
MAFVRPVIRAALDRTGDPVAALERTNRILVEERPTGLLVTVLCGVLDLDSGVFEFANAGHEPPLVVSGTRPRETRWVETGGVLVGAFRHLDLEPGRVELASGDVLALYTDGITDAVDGGRERFGADRLANLVAEHGAISAAAVVDGVVSSVSAFEGPERADDLALLVVRRS